MELNDKIQRIKDIKEIAELLNNSADKITNLICIYDYNDEIDSKGIYYSVAGNLMNHYGMLEYTKEQIQNYIKTGKYNYTDIGDE